MRAGARDLSVAVIGAGPAGSTAARLLAARGARVYLLEAKRLPRHKLCGGGLTPKALPLLPPGALACIDRRIGAFELAGGRAGPVTLRLRDVEIAMIERAPFDYALLNAAVAAGAEVSDGTQVLDVADDQGGQVRLTTRSGTLAVDAVIAADGEPSRTAMRLGLGREPERRSLGLEVDLPFAASRDRDTLQLRFGIPSGYAWSFPKGDHVNVGILTSDARRQPALRTMLARYVAELGLRLDGAHVQGHWIPKGLRRGPTVRGRVLLAGDAAGTADPFFGEGLSFGMASGALAATTLSEWATGRIPSPGVYDRRLREAIGPGFARLSLVAGIADRVPSLSIVALATIAWARGEARRGLLGLGHPFELPPIDA